MINKKILLGAAAGTIATLSLGAAALSLAASGTSTSPAMHAGMGVGGTVSAISGNTITVTGKNGTTYTVDATSATITKDMTVGVADVKVGDTVMAAGAVNGTSVAATTIHDGQMSGGMMGGFRGRGPGGMGVHGTVSSVSGNTLTVTETNPKDNTTSTYTVDASNATVMVGSGTAGTKPTTGSVSNIKTGDTVSVMGTLNGTTVTAKMIIDGPLPTWGKKPASTSTTSTTTQ